jgi:hypothetical protein
MKRALFTSVLALAGSYAIAANAQQAPPPTNTVPVPEPEVTPPTIYTPGPTYVTPPAPPTVNTPGPVYVTPAAPPQGEVAAPTYEKARPAPARAFEINVATAYNQGWGNLTDSTTVAQGRLFIPGRKVQDVGGAGLQFELDLGYRATPMFAVHAYGTAAGYTNQTSLEGTNFRSVTAGLQGQVNLSPFRSVNPWVTLGTGWRGAWVVPDVGGNVSIQGWQLARLQVGADIRVANVVAVGPYIAGDVNLLFSQRLPGGEFQGTTGTPTFATFTAGILGRFDVGGYQVTPGGAAVAAR